MTISTAYEDYAAAYQKDPTNLYYKTSYQRLKFTAAAVHTHQGEKLRDQGDMNGAMTEFLRALEIDPSNELAQQDVRITKEKIAATPTNEPAETPQSEAPLADIASPAQLTPTSNEPITVHMPSEDSKVVYQTIGKLAGINVLFDPDYTGKRIAVDLQNVSLMDALHIVGVISNTFWRPVTAQHHLRGAEHPRKAHGAGRAGGADLLSVEHLADQRPERHSDRAPQCVDERQALRGAQPERHRDACDSG